MTTVLSWLTQHLHHRLGKDVWTGLFIGSHCDLKGGEDGAAGAWGTCVNGQTSDEDPQQSFKLAEVKSTVTARRY